MIAKVRPVHLGRGDELTGWDSHGGANQIQG